MMRQFVVGYPHVDDIQNQRQDRYCNEQKD